MQDPEILLRPWTDFSPARRPGRSFGRGRFLEKSGENRPERGPMKETVGILHPGEMGVSVGASARKSGCAVYWAAEARSQKTRERAESHGLVDTSTVAKLCEACSVIISVCPPHAAEEVGDRVLACSFKGLYVDANAISPQRVRRIGEAMTKGGAAFVDGGIIGGPAWEAGTTCLYLSGREAHRAAACFSSGPLETKVSEIV